MGMNDIIRQSANTVRSLCDEHKVRTLYVFGSVLTPDFRDESDIDLLVDFDAATIPDYADNFFAFKHALEQTWGRRVDLVEDKAIRNPIFRSNVDRTKTIIYG